MNIVVITARMDSSRLPGKALLDIGGTPNLLRIVRRFRKCKQVNEIVIATSDDSGDDAIEVFCNEHNLSYYRGSKTDVLGRVYGAAVEAGCGDNDYVLRATTDCPFVSWNLIDLGFSALAEYNTHTARVWGAPDRMIPAYGAAEFPVKLSAIKTMHETVHPSDPLREHAFADIDARRLHYHVVYLAPPISYQKTFYAPYRLELDTSNDLTMISKIICELGDEPPLERVIRFLDAHPDIARLNGGEIEKTGPLTSYAAEQRAEWRFQQNAATQEWRGDWTWLELPSDLPKDARALFCKRGTCFVGYIRGLGRKAVLVRPDGVELFGKAEVPCACGAGRTWHEAK